MLKWLRKIFIKEKPEPYVSYTPPDVPHNKGLRYEEQELHLEDWHEHIGDCDFHERLEQEEKMENWKKKFEIKITKTHCTTS